MQLISENKIAEGRIKLDTQKGSECKRQIRVGDCQADSG